ncbi:hypothetical protein EUGRSUZ_G00708 [Eucalyptus grandis]|uniref:Uncharacterized protein n=2 Tax=Eucalyptus grandis TaxID=71139 RepID=A0ACC3K1X1_EUCGR|nr:hypothetical protein EUGRSUZ_G00708 [Eucalyptus grandis]
MSTTEYPPINVDMRNQASAIMELSCSKWKMPSIAMTFQSSFNSGGIICIQPSVLDFVWKSNLIRFAKFMAVPMHIHQQSLGGTKVTTAHHKIFQQRVSGSFLKTHVKKSPQTMALILQDSMALKLTSREHYGKLFAYRAAFMRETSLKAEDALCV